MAIRAENVTSGQHDWYASSGFRSPTDYMTCAAYARRLARYIADATTIRVRTLDAFGKAPTVEAIRQMREGWLMQVKERAERGYISGIANDPKSLGLVDPVADVAPPQIVQLPLTYSSVHDVIEACAAVGDVTYGEIIGSSRERRITYPRMLACAILKARGNSYPQVGRRMGGRDHSTAIHSVRTFFSVVIKEPKYREAWERLAPVGARRCSTIKGFDAFLARSGR